MADAVAGVGAAADVLRASALVAAVNGEAEACAAFSLVSAAADHAAAYMASGADQRPAYVVDMTWCGIDAPPANVPVWVPIAIDQGAALLRRQVDRFGARLPCEVAARLDDSIVGLADVAAAGVSALRAGSVVVTIPAGASVAGACP